MEKQQVYGMKNPDNLNNYNVNMSNVLVRASHGLTLIEKRLIAAAIAKIDSRKGSNNHAHLAQFQCLKLTVIEYMDTYGANPKNAYGEMRRAADTLLTRHVTFNYFGKGDKKRISKVNWLSSATYADDEGFLELSFTPELYPHLNALKSEYTQYRLQNAASLRSTYSWRLFEFAKSWLNYAEIDNGTVTVTLVQLREALDVPVTYRWDNVRKRVLEPATSEILKINGLKITYEIIKKGRSVHSLCITMEQVNQIEADI
jgi:plasmid replication initiation protein